VVEGHRRQDVGVAYTCGVALTQAVHVDPLESLLGARRRLVRWLGMAVAFWLSNWDSLNTFTRGGVLRRGISGHLRAVDAG